MKFSELTGDHVVHCPTKELSERFLALCERKGIIVFDVTKQYSFEDYRQQTCYRIENSCLYYSPMHLYKSLNCTVINACDILSEEYDENVLIDDSEDWQSGKLHFVKNDGDVNWQLLYSAPKKGHFYERQDCIGGYIPFNKYVKANTGLPE